MIKQLVSGNLLYNQYKARWEFLYNSYIGGQDYRDAGYLTRYVNESPAEYKARCDATPLDNQCRSVISVYNSFLFRNGPDRDLKSLVELPEFESFLEDADLEGRSLDNFMKEVSTWSHVFGHSWIIMSKPNIDATTLAEQQAYGIRPYVSLLTPLVVLDWKWERNINGKYDLSYFKYIEDVNGDVTTYKIWTKDTIETYVINTTHDKFDNEPIIEDNQLGTIPAIIAYSERSLVRGIGVSSIDDVADMQRYIYNALSEADQSIRLDSHPSLVTTQDTQIGTGAGSIIQIPENIDPGLRPYILDFNGASIDAIYTVIDKSIAAIERSSNIGGVRTTETQTKSGVALQTEFQLLNAKLAGFSANLELTEEQLWRLFCQYQAQPYDVSIDYPVSFEIHDEDNEIQQLQVAKSAATDPRILAAIDAKILDWLDLDEDEITAIMNPKLLDMESIPEMSPMYEQKIMIDPVSGKMVITQSPDQELQLAKDGWVEKDEKYE